MLLKNKNIVLCVSGGIAAYKSIEVLRLLVKAGAFVKVILTENAVRFVPPLTFEVLSNQVVCTDLFNCAQEGSVSHISWAAAADAVIVAPATANTIAKLAMGIADDALSTFMLAVTSVRIICPAMNTHMYENRAVQRNIDILEQDGYKIVESGSGELACGTTGPGRMAEPQQILDTLIFCLYKKDLAGKKVLVTAGPTREAIDPVRYITNHSSGKMGYAIAKEAVFRGADVTLITGPVNCEIPFKVNAVCIETADEMTDAVFEHFDGSHIVIKVAAVADYKPDSVAEHKIKKEKKGMTINLVKNRDILLEIGKRKKDQFIVGFAAETRDLKVNARAKLLKKNLDIIVGNIVGKSDSGFSTDTNRVTFFFKDGANEVLPLMDKTTVAKHLIDRIIEKAFI